jgi:hypothetical protein
MENFDKNRPQGFTGKGDEQWPVIIDHLEDLLYDMENHFETETLELLYEDWDELAYQLVEFAEDIHNDIGIWKSLEQYNLKFFGTALPLTPVMDEDDSHFIQANRIHHFLWIMFSVFEPDLILAPTHKDLLLLTKKVTDFLNEWFVNVPKDSGVKKFLAQSDRYGWDVKRKLIWLGRQSYLFRNHFRDYLEERGEEDRIAVVDDFVNQENTSWSGLGVIDILAETLNISNKQKKELRSWYERHLSFYKILSVTGATIKALNLINNKNYAVRVGEDMSRLFKINEIYFGSLVPWNQEWYWSGSQANFPEPPQQQLQQIKQEMVIKSPQVVYRFEPSLLKHAKESLKKHHDNFVEFKGSDFIIYPNGRSMVADLKKWHQFLFEAAPDHIKQEFKDKHKVSEYSVNIPFPQEIIDFENGIGLFYNPDEGQEIMLNFNSLMSGMHKKGKNLSEDEEDTIRQFIQSDAISPRFVKMIADEYGSESIAASFLIRDWQNDYYLEYLLRRYKGHYFRNRYPAVSLVI